MDNPRLSRHRSPFLWANRWKMENRFLGGRRKRKRKSEREWEREREGRREERTSAPWITMRLSRLLHRHNYDSIPIADSSYSGLIFKSLYHFLLLLSVSRWMSSLLLRDPCCSIQFSFWKWKKEERFIYLYSFFLLEFNFFSFVCLLPLHFLFLIHSSS